MHRCVAVYSLDLVDFCFRLNSEEYITVMPIIQKLVDTHKNNLMPGEPQLNVCDRSVMNWAPPGCEKLGRCLPVPSPAPHNCTWPH